MLISTAIFLSVSPVAQAESGRVLERAGLILWKALFLSHEIFLAWQAHTNASLSCWLCLTINVWINMLPVFFGNQGRNISWQPCYKFTFHWVARNTLMWCICTNMSLKNKTKKKLLNAEYVMHNSCMHVRLAEWACMHAVNEYAGGKASITHQTCPSVAFVSAGGFGC